MATNVLPPDLVERRSDERETFALINALKRIIAGITTSGSATTINIVVPGVQLTDTDTDPDHDAGAFMMPPGTVGATGATGSTGPQGVQGIQGLAGDDGDEGAMGLPGRPGADGRPGMTILGLDGDDGLDGVPGLQGIQGPAGATGIAIQALDGDDGQDGLPGAQGRQGDSGQRGLPGADGQDGDDAGGLLPLAETSGLPLAALPSEYTTTGDVATTLNGDSRIRAATDGSGNVTYAYSRVCVGPYVITSLATLAIDDGAVLAVL